MTNKLLKGMTKAILKTEAAKPILRLGIVKRRLGNTSLYPEWTRDLKRETDIWASGSPDWRAILKDDSSRWNSALADAATGPKVLMATSVGGFPGSNTLESMLAVALTLRGAQVHILLCDQHLPGCFMNFIRQFPDTAEFAKRGPSYLCEGCYPNGYNVFQPLGLPIHLHSKLISSKELRMARKLAADVPFSDIPKYRLDGIAVGDDALSSTLHFFARGDLVSEPHAEAILRRYFLASLFSMYEIQRLLNTYPFSCVCAHHGIYVPHGIFNQVCRKLAVRFAAWAPAYRNQTFIFSHDDSYHHTMMVEPTTQWENMPWNAEMETEIVDYLTSRRYGTHDWVTYQQNTEEDLSTIAADLGVDFSKPCIGLLTNVIWDAQVTYPANAFPNMVEWALQTLQYFVRRPDLQLIIRAHPAEVQHHIRSRQFIADEIHKAFPELPPNIFIIPSDKPVNTYAVMSQCDTVIIYATKAGLELACMGIPVVVAGDAWARNKGFTLDARSAEEYFTLLDRLPLGKRLPESETRRARKYAYHFFFRRMIPIPFLKAPGPYTLELSGLDELLPGRSIGLDIVCNGILKGDQFTYPFESALESHDDHLTKKS